MLPYKTQFIEALPVKLDNFLIKVRNNEVELSRYKVIINFPETTKVNFMSNSSGFGFYGDENSGITLTLLDHLGKEVGKITDFEDIEELSSDFGKFSDVYIRQGDKEIQVNVPTRSMSYSKEIPKHLLPKKSKVLRSPRKSLERP
jgi:hypothetical protein